ncbi:Long-chain base-1-phosphate phosphatase [Rhodotorula toruloides]
MPRRAPIAPSRSSTGSSTPSEDYADGTLRKDAGDAVVGEEEQLAVGCREEEYYRSMMPGWRFWVRRRLMQRLSKEMETLQGIQIRWRTPFRDEYFVKTSLLGTHTFFMIFLPLWYWFGDAHIGRGLLHVLAIGAYVTSVAKDAFSVPRPYSPPIVRLSVGSHALEYGFPSTHSSNACSMALFFASLVLERWEGHWAVSAGAVGMAAFFAWSVTFGRLYTGMHSITDVVIGSLIGILIFTLHRAILPFVDPLIFGTAWKATLASIPILLALVTFHPEPAEECPCFEDAVAFLSVVQGVTMRDAYWPQGFASRTHGHEWRSESEVGAWAASVLLKLVVGISTILVWRIIAKQVCHVVLPPLFRFFAPLIRLPRRGYKPATEYEAYPPTISLDPVPSILDLPSLVDEAEVSPSLSRGATSSLSSSLTNGKDLRNRSSLAPPAPGSLEAPPLHKAGGTAAVPHRSSLSTGAAEESGHLDADVLTKVMVYSGIGWLASAGIPGAFELYGWSVR